MNLKEAFRYQNFLERTVEGLTAYLSSTSSVMKITQEHLRKRANAEAEDETIDTTSERRIQYPINTLVDFVVLLMAEKEKLCAAISKTKNGCGVDIDSAIAINKWKQSVSHTFAGMGNIKSQERITRGQSYKFNAEGNQVSYAYDVKEVSVIDFDRNKVKSIAKKLIAEADTTSTGIDKIMVDAVVKYDPPYDVNDTLDDMLEVFAESYK